ncbi:hypothetical protein BDP81DRAFT_79741 [Colletotrichum phormii]|uniref:Uncharacterized protein n=1 Tax=Colletotrichum phormii TaxID=359342 RepID=A0AAJ0A0N8_9PEZI|nr:uncharacterized protein BDP81DRAFT_79741 [Colletotrichum phormii]KAK1654231.1 hypothetical protein BDP81DRAFT_79741 [Colletotrichum phormii]
MWEIAPLPLLNAADREGVPPAGQAEATYQRVISALCCVSNYCIHITLSEASLLLSLALVPHGTASAATYIVYMFHGPIRQPTSSVFPKPPRRRGHGRRRSLPRLHRSADTSVQGVYTETVQVSPLLCVMLPSPSMIFPFRGQTKLVLPHPSSTKETLPL